MSPKNQRELEGIASSVISVELLKVQKVFSVRWVFLPLFQLKQFCEILQCYTCIFVSVHQQIVTDRARKKEIYSGLTKKLQSCLSFRKS